MRHSVAILWLRRKWARVVEQSGERVAIAGAVVTLLGLIADFLSPWYNVLAFLFPLSLVMTGAFAYLWLRTDHFHAPEGRQRRLARYVHYSLIATLVLAPIFAFNLATQEDGGAIASVSSEARELQFAITARLDQLERALALVAEQGEDTRSAVGEVSRKVQNTGQTVDRIEERAITIERETTASSESLRTSEALATMKAVTETRDGASLGQAEAVSLLTSKGHRFSGADFSGVALISSNVSNGLFKRARFHFSDLSDSTFTSADLSDAGMSLATVAGVNFSDANLTGAFAPFVDGNNARFDRANLSRSNFLASNLMRANFSGAMLRSASFAFADLTDADFSGADLSGAYFTGAVLTGATFDGATFDGTNMHGVILEADQLTGQQVAESCRHTTVADGHFRIQVLERWQSDRFPSGYEYDDLTEHRYYGPTPTLASSALPVCDTPMEGSVAFNANYSTDIDVRVEREYMDPQDRRGQMHDRLEEHFEGLQTAYTTQRAFSGSTDNEQQLLSELSTNTDCDTGPETTLFSSDGLLVALLANDLVEPETVSWRAAAVARLNLENRLSESHRSANPGGAQTNWPAFFPPGTAATDLPKDVGSPFRAWTECRASKVDGALWLSILAYPGDRSSAPKEGEVIYSGRFDHNYIEKISSGVSYSRYKWGGSEAAILDHVESTDFVIGIPADVSPLQLDNAVFSFGDTFGQPWISVPSTAIVPSGIDPRRYLRRAELRVELNISAIDVFGENPRVGVISVGTGKAQIYRGENLVYEDTYAFH